MGGSGGLTVARDASPSCPTWKMSVACRTDEGKAAGGVEGGTDFRFLGDALAGADEPCPIRRGNPGGPSL